MKLLGLESSCDDTGVAVVEEGRRILVNLVSSQQELHARYGGVIPEIASRQHIVTFVPLLEEALLPWKDREGEGLSGIAVTVGPGLAGSLMVGVNLAKALALAWGLPLVGVNHLEGHIYACWLGEGEEPPFPLLALVVSGGHTELVFMRGHGQYQGMGRTRDDAAGEAFDKVARLLGLGFPGGPAIEKAASLAKASHPLPRAWLGGSHDFSFSGLKTAVLRLVEGGGGPIPDIAAGFQEAVVAVLVRKTVAAAREYGARCILLAGGVAANRLLRQRLQEASPIPVHCPSLSLCTDNAAMVAAAGYYRLKAGLALPLGGGELDVHPSLPLG